MHLVPVSLRSCNQNSKLRAVAPNQIYRSNVSIPLTPAIEAVRSQPWLQRHRNHTCSQVSCIAVGLAKNEVACDTKHVRSYPHLGFLHSEAPACIKSRCSTATYTCMKSARAQSYSVGERWYGTGFVEPLTPHPASTHACCHRSRICSGPRYSTAPTY